MNLRLWIEYALIALVLAVGGLAVTLKVQTLRQENSIHNLATGLEKANEHIADAEGQIEVIRGVNEAQGKVIKTLADQRKIDGDSIVQLMDTYQTLQLQDRSLRSKLDNLERDDGKAKEYLDAPIPESVACLWDESCAASPSTNGNSGTGGDSKGYPASGSAKSMLLAPEPKAISEQGSNPDLSRLEELSKKVQGPSRSAH